MMSIARIRAQLIQILHLRESPHRTALAFATGVFIAFSPIYPHTLLVFFCGWAFRLNLLAILAGAFINNPWTIVPIVGATLWTGFRLMGMPETPPLSWHDLSFTSIYDQVLPYAIPFLAGGAVLSLLGAMLGYPAAYFLISRYRNRFSHPAEEPLPPGTGLG
jgi:uncharacterized protein (DUF2062 family)